MKYFIVQDHLGGFFFKKCNGDPKQIDKLQAICPICGDNNWVVGEFGSFGEGKKVIHEYVKDDDLTLEDEEKLVGKLKELYGVK